MTIAENLALIKTEIFHALQEVGRAEEKIKLVVVSKGQSIAKIEEAIKAGQKEFAENYLQEALEKIAALSSYQLHWHFIGPIQSNKTKAIANHFSWVHTVSRLKIAERLNQQRPSHLPPLNICVQVNISCEATKSGLHPDEVEDFFVNLQQFQRLHVRGLMVIPKVEADYHQQLMTYQKVVSLFRQLKQHWAIDTLSMGMSNDFKAAIAAGSTLVRIGRSVFDQKQ